VVPVMYSLVDDAMALFQKHFVGEVEAEPGAPSPTRPVAAEGAAARPSYPQGDPEAEEVEEAPETVGASLRRSVSDSGAGGGPGRGPGPIPGGRGGLDPRPI